mgnify:CR=1 FL=1
MTTLCQIALTDLHPSWLPHLDADLILAGKRTGAGRRWLTEVLALDFSLFADAQVFSKDVQAPTLAHWLFEPLSQLNLVVLGALSYSPVIKTTVARDQVSLLIELLGEQMYPQVLDTQLQSTEPGLPPLEFTQEGIEHQFELQGAVECYHFARQQNELAAQRIRLAFPRLWPLEELPAQLPMDLINATQSLWLSRENLEVA